MDWHRIVTRRSIWQRIEEERQRRTQRRTQRRIQNVAQPLVPRRSLTLNQNLGWRIHAALPPLPIQQNLGWRIHAALPLLPIQQVEHEDLARYLADVGIVIQRRPPTLEAVQRYLITLAQQAQASPQLPAIQRILIRYSNRFQYFCPLPGYAVMPMVVALDILLIYLPFRTAFARRFTAWLTLCWLGISVTRNEPHFNEVAFTFLSDLFQNLFGIDNADEEVEIAIVNASNGNGSNSISQFLVLFVIIVLVEIFGYNIIKDQLWHWLGIPVIEINILCGFSSITWFVILVVCAISALDNATLINSLNMLRRRIRDILWSFVVNYLMEKIVWLYYLFTIQVPPDNPPSPAASALAALNSLRLLIHGVASSLALYISYPVSNFVVYFLEVGMSFLAITLVVYPAAMIFRIFMAFVLSVGLVLFIFYILFQVCSIL